MRFDTVPLDELYMLQDDYATLRNLAEQNEDGDQYDRTDKIYEEITDEINRRDDHLNYLYGEGKWSPDRIYELTHDEPYLYSSDFDLVDPDAMEA